MKFQVICMRNKLFLDKVLTAMVGFVLAIAVAAAVFPLHQENPSANEVTYTYTTNQDQAENN